MKRHATPGAALERAAAHVVDAALQIHRAVGPGMLESAYEAMLEYELIGRGLCVERQKYLSLMYGGLEIERAYCVDLLVQESLVVEIKSVDTVGAVHMKQLITYLKVGGFNLGLLLNFGQVTLKAGGIHRLVNRL